MAKEVGLIVRGTPIRYDVKAKQLTCLGTSAPVELSEGTLTLRVLVDRSTIEIFAADGRVNMAYGFLPPEGNKSLAVFAGGGAAAVQSLDVWELKSTWTACGGMKPPVLIGLWRFQEECVQKAIPTRPSRSRRRGGCAPAWPGPFAAASSHPAGTRATRPCRRPSSRKRECRLQPAGCRRQSP